MEYATPLAWRINKTSERLLQAVALLKILFVMNALMVIISYDPLKSEAATALETAFLRRHVIQKNVKNAIKLPEYARYLVMNV
jgi:hypothetical protein